MAGPLLAPRPLAPARVGLISSRPPIVDPVDEPKPGEQRVPERWLGGFGYWGPGCFDVNVETPKDPCATGEDRVKDPPPPGWSDSYSPFLIYAGDGCSTLDRVRDRPAMARQRLARSESFRVAREFWAGDIAAASGNSNRYLTDGGAEVINSGTAMCPEDALGCLEQALGECLGGERGMIHAPRAIVTAWMSAYLIEPTRQGTLITAFDTLVVPDSGYPNEGFAYGTGLVDLRLSVVVVNPPEGDPGSSVNRSNNDQIFRAERYAAVTWDGCCHLAVEVDVDTCTVGS